MSDEPSIELVRQVRGAYHKAVLACRNVNTAQKTVCHNLGISSDTFYNCMLTDACRFFDPKCPKHVKYCRSFVEALGYKTRGPTGAWQSFQIAVQKSNKTDWFCVYYNKHGQERWDRRLSSIMRLYYGY